MTRRVKNQRGGLKLGVIGVGTRWEQAILPALNRLRQRTQIVAVYHPVANLSLQVANSCRAKSVHGIKSLLQEQEVEAVLLLDGQWLSEFVLEQLCRLHIPAVVSLCALVKIQNLSNIHDKATSCGLTLMPELNLRHTPATIRLRELMATRLGTAQHIEIQAPRNAQLLHSILDWCHFIFGRKAQSISSTMSQSTEATGNGSNAEFVQHIKLQFDQPGPAPKNKTPRNRAPDDRTVTILLTIETPAEEPENSRANSSDELCCAVTLTNGQATLIGSNHITWRDSQSLHEESLESDRNDVEVLLDHFCRRVVGGLIPVPDLSDLFICQQLITAIETSLSTGKTVSVT